ncbi:hypothetical protein Tco_0994654 [Tanacetum coccineum]
MGILKQTQLVFDSLEDNRCLAGENWPEYNLRNDGGNNDTWTSYDALRIFETSLRRGKFDESHVLPDGSLMEITKVYPLDAVYDTPGDVKSNKRYAGWGPQIGPLRDANQACFTVDVENRMVESMLVGNGVKVGNFLYRLANLFRNIDVRVYDCHLSIKLFFHIFAQAFCPNNEPSKSSISCSDISTWLFMKESMVGLASYFKGDSVKI